MVRFSCMSALAVVACLAIAGCGSDNSSNDNNSNTPVATRTTTPGPPVATPTLTALPPTVTPSAGQSSNGPTLTPSPTQTTSGLDCEGEGAALKVTVTSDPGSDLDTGFTGIAHNSVATHDSTVTTNLDCQGDDCTVDGSALVGTNFGSPLPLSSGGVPVCVINTFTDPVTGTYNCASGCSDSQVKLQSKVFLVQDIAKPCPLCVGDPTPNDGQKGGTCESGTAPGAPCDVGGISDEFGATSNDCLPTGSSVGELAIDLTPLTTGKVSVDASMDCVSPLFPKGTCYCPGQIQPNSCNDGVCPASFTCENGPIDGLCANQKFRSCRSGTGTADCEDVFPGSGSCIDSPRPCFGTNITRQGQCGTQSGVLAAFFCVPATRAAAINTTGGLPGPGAIVLPAHQVRTPR